MKKSIAMKNKTPEIWSGGQLLAFSGIDGKTDFRNGICLRTGRSGYNLKLKEGYSSELDGKIFYEGQKPDYIELAGDFSGSIQMIKQVQVSFVIPRIFSWK